MGRSCFHTQTSIVYGVPKCNINSCWNTDQMSISLECTQSLVIKWTASILRYVCRTPTLTAKLSIGMILFSYANDNCLWCTINSCWTLARCRFPPCTQSRELPTVMAINVSIGRPCFHTRISIVCGVPKWSCWTPTRHWMYTVTWLFCLHSKLYKEEVIIMRVRINLTLYTLQRPYELREYP